MVEGIPLGIDKGQAFEHFKERKVESRFVTKAKDELGKLPPKNEANAGSHQKWERDIEPEHLDPGYHPRPAADPGRRSRRTRPSRARPCPCGKRA